MRMLDLFCGRWGWSKAFAARGWKCVGIDLVEPPEVPQACTWVGMNILEIGHSIPRFTFGIDWVREFDFICASPPCEQFSVWGMRHFHPNPPYPELGIKLFEHTRRICEESGVPYVIENVRAAQQFVGNAVHHCGPFYLWGNAVPPLMPKGIGKGTHDIRGVPVNRTRRLYFNKRAGKNVPITERAAWKENSPGSKGRKECTAELAMIPPLLAGCVADYAGRLCEQRQAVCE